MIQSDFSTMQLFVPSEHWQEEERPCYTDMPLEIHEKILKFISGENYPAKTDQERDANGSDINALVALRATNREFRVLATRSLNTLLHDYLQPRPIKCCCGLTNYRINTIPRAISRLNLEGRKKKLNSFILKNSELFSSLSVDDFQLLNRNERGYCKSPLTHFRKIQLLCHQSGTSGLLSYIPHLYLTPQKQEEFIRELIDIGLDFEYLELHNLASPEWETKFKALQKKVFFAKCAEWATVAAIGTGIIFSSKKLLRK